MTALSCFFIILLANDDCVELANLYTFHTSGTFSGVVHQHVLMYQSIVYK